MLVSVGMFKWIAVKMQATRVTRQLHRIPVVPLNEAEETHGGAVIVLRAVKLFWFASSSA